MNHPPTSKIEKLIAELCPDGVEFKELGECIDKNIGGGTPPRNNSSYWSGDISWASVGDLSIHGNYIKSTRSMITKEGLENSSTHLVQKGAAIVAVKITPGKMKIAGTDIAINQDLRGLVLKDFLDVDFLTYYFQTINLIGNGTIVKGITNGFLEKTRIPVPSREVQEEIVKILDSFTQLEAELEAELEARKKQYEYYRNELLTCNDGVRFAVLGEILNRTKGTPITAGKMSELNKEGAPIKIFAGGRTVAYVDYGDIPDKDVLTKESVVVKSRGIIAFEYIDKPFSHKNEFWSYHSNNPDINIKYIYYYLKNKELYFQTVGQKMSKMPQLSIPDTDKFQIPLPPLVEQERIVSILDKFDAIVNDISIGLPAELSARRSQYEYYRGKLLDFPLKKG